MCQFSLIPNSKLDNLDTTTYNLGTLKKNFPHKMQPFLAPIRETELSHDDLLKGFNTLKRLPLTKKNVMQTSVRQLVPEFCPLRLPKEKIFHNFQTNLGNFEHSVRPKTQEARPYAQAMFPRARICIQQGEILSKGALSFLSTC